ncbi:MAG TPA: tagaturonate epimerase family protein [Bacteroidales bacterium]|nr:tagaturonate epimerase family protein [Bacteroidales bacterium]
MKIGKYSFGTGDRFAHQGEAQLRAIIQAKEAGIDITPVWNKSHREHTTIKSEPRQTLQEARDAVTKLVWKGDFFVDADHINLNNVEHFLKSSNFFTIDVADYIGKKVDSKLIENFIIDNKRFIGNLNIPGISKPFKITRIELEEIAGKYLYAVNEAEKIFLHIAENKGIDQFVAEVSMDEVDEPQTPVELFFILSALSRVNLPLQTIAPKFTGRFNKGVDYAGNIKQFAREFEEDLLVIDYAVKEFGLPDNLKLSVHSGSDKFSIYPVMGELIKKHDKGIHVKTAGTTWLEEVIGLALAGGEALEIVKTIYKRGLNRFDELCGPYATVIDIDKSKLPTPEEIDTWDGEKFANTLRHDQQHPDYNLNFRQLIHVSYKIAAEMGTEYTQALEEHEDIVGRQVTENIYERHIKRLFDL